MGRDEAASGLMSTGSGSGVWEKFVKFAGENGLSKAGREFGVETELEECLTVSRESKALGVTVKESNLGLQIHRIFEKIGVSRERQPTLLRILNAVAQYDKPEDVLEASAQVIDAQLKSGLPLPDMLIHYEKRVKEFKELQEREVSRKVAAIAGAEARSAREIERQKADSLSAMQDERKKFEAEQAALLEDVKRKALVEQTNVATAKRELEELKGKVASETARLEQVKQMGSQERSELKEFREQKDQFVRRTEDVEREITAMAAYGVDRPEDRVKILAEVEKFGGNAGKLVELVRRYDGMVNALKSIRGAVTRTKGMARRVTKRKEEAGARLTSTLSRLKQINGQKREVDAELRAKKVELAVTEKKLARELGVKEDLQQIEEANRLEADKFKAFKLELKKAESEGRRKKREELKAFEAEERVKIKERLGKRREDLGSVVAGIRKATRQKKIIEKQVREVERERDIIAGERDKAYDAIQKMDERLKQVTPLTTIATVLDNPANPVDLEKLYRASLAVFHALEISLVVLPIACFHIPIEMELKRLTKEVERQARELEIRARSAARHDQ
jgi:hypothetical protein